MRAVITLVGGIACALTTMAAPTRPWTAAEMSYADHLPAAAEPLNLSGQVEHLVLTTSHDRTGHLLPARPALGSRQEQQLQRALCQADTVALALARAPLGRMNTARTTIHSKIDVELLDVIKADGDRQPGDVLPVLNPGGEVRVAGREVRVQAVGAQPFAEEGVYLLLMSRPQPSSPFFTAHGVTVSDGRVRLANGAESWFHLSGGEAYADVRADVRRLLSFACP